MSTAEPYSLLLPYNPAELTKETTEADAIALWQAAAERVGIIVGPPTAVHHKRTPAVISIDGHQVSLSEGQRTIHTWVVTGPVIPRNNE